MKKHIFCFFIVLISVGYLQGQKQLICKKCPKNTVFFWDQCVVPTPDGQPCSLYENLCKNSTYTCIRKNVSSGFTCDKCNDNQFISINDKICLDKIKDGEICQDHSEKCLNPDFSCLKDSRGDFRCGKCTDSQFLDEMARECIDIIKDGQICSSTRDKCVNPEFSCLILNNNDNELRCGKCNATQFISYEENRCKNNVKDGKECSSLYDQCESPFYECLKKKATDRKFYCLKCNETQYVSYEDYTCKNMVKDGKECLPYFDRCESPFYSCLKKKTNDKKFYCLKCNENQFINYQNVCKNKIGNGKACKDKWEKCQTEEYYCLKK
ncbi:unnamed protein product [Brachionus calyciflorus]|uniref:Uncharacterized protein n=1 Tax=Brachionus calyciflorus TaxID=104777 RepID=A0A813PIQ9_9BILA|nr:unnamed protein product [Brachionus calyciflorus]